MVEVHGKDGRSGVQHGVQGRHDGCDEGRKHEAREPSREKIRDENRIGHVRSGDLVRVEDVGHDPGNDRDKGNQKLQVGGEHDSVPPLFDVPGSQRPLGDELVASPVEEVGDPEPPEEDGEPGELGVVQWEHHVELVPGLFHQSSPPTHGLQPQPRRQCAPEKEHGPLYEVRPHNGLESSVRRIGSSEDGQDRYAPPER